MKRQSLPGASLRRHLLFLIIGVIGVSGAVLLGILASLRAQAISAGERLTESLASVIAEQTTRTLQTVDQRLQITSDRIASLSPSEKLDARAGRALLLEEISGMPFVLALSITDARGLFVSSSDPAVPGQSVADRAYFKMYAEHPETRFFISPPIRGRINDVWILTASRPLPAIEGRFAGLVIAALELRYFDRLWRPIHLGEGGAIALFRRDGTLMMRSPFDENSIGRAFPALPVIGMPFDTNPSGHFSTASFIDGRRRVFAYQVLPSQPELIAVVGQTYDLILGPWRQLAAITLSIWAIASVVIVGFGVFLNRAWLEGMTTAEAAREMTERLAHATEASSIGVWDWDLEADRWYATPTYFTMLGYEAQQGIFRRSEWLDHIHPDDRGMVAANIQAALAGGEVPYCHEARVLHADGSYHWVSVIGRVVARDEAGRPGRLIGVILDITESKRAEASIRASLSEKEALLKEVHHRVKNNLQVITSLLRLESGRSRDSATRDILKEMQARIRSMALLHELLYRTGRFARVDLADYLGKLTTQLFRAQNTAPGTVTLATDLSSASVSIDQAIPCGLIVNELLTNSLKHGFAGGQAGEVRVGVRVDTEGRIRIELSDNGAGLPEDFETKRGGSLGLLLVSDLARQLGGKLEIGPLPSSRFVVTFAAPDDIPHP